MITANDARIMVINRSSAILQIDTWIVTACEEESSYIVYHGNLTNIEVGYLRNKGYVVYLSDVKDVWIISWEE